MKAVSLDLAGPDRSRLVDVELATPVPKPGEVLVRARAVSFNPVDVQIRRSGSAPLWSPILGRDIAGVVEAVAPGVSGLRPGDEVFSYVCNLASSGTFAEFVSVPAELVARRPAALNWPQAAAVPVAGLTALFALERAGVGPGSSLFIAGGAGGVGSFAVVLARHLGVERLVVSARKEDSRRYLMQSLQLAADRIVDSGDPRELAARATAANGGPFDAALDLVGGGLLTACCELVDIEGRVASVTEFPSAADGEHLFRRNASFCAIGAHALSLSAQRSRWAGYRARLAELARRFDAGELPPPSVVVVGPFSAATVEAAHARLERGAVQGKLAMVF